MHSRSLPSSIWSPLNHSSENWIGPTGRTGLTWNRPGIRSGHSSKTPYEKIEREPLWTTQKLPNQTNRTGFSGWVVFWKKKEKKLKMASFLSQFLKGGKKRKFETTSFCPFTAPHSPPRAKPSLSLMPHCPSLAVTTRSATRSAIKMELELIWPKVEDEEEVEWEWSGRRKRRRRKKEKSLLL